MDYLDQLSRFVRDTTFATLGDSVVVTAKNVLLDTVGAILAGSRLPENARLARLCSERSGRWTATLIGTPQKADPMLATLANATAGVSLEVDEGNRWGGGHPAIHVVPAGLAVGEETSSDGRRFIESLVVGYEVTSRIGGAMRPRSNVHSHGTWGAIGAAVAAAKLLGCTAREIREVINLAASMSPANSWTPCFEGATIRNLYPGRAGLQGILAVHLLRCGYTGLADGPSDIYGTILGESFEPGSVVDGLGEEYRIERNYFKFHACCLYNHPALDAVRAIARAERFNPEEVARITVTSIPFATLMAGPYPRNMLAAKFSIPYAVAAALVVGRTDVSAFSDPAIQDPRIRDLAQKVEVSSDPEMSMRRSDYPTASVTITLKDGRVFSQTTTVVRGDAGNPGSGEELVDKFLALAGESLGEAKAKEVVDTVGRVEELKDLKELTALLATGVQGSRTLG